MLVSLTLLASCSKELETTPTDKTTSDVVFSTGSGAYAAINGIYRDWETDRKSTRLNSSHSGESRMPSSS